VLASKEPCHEKKSVVAVPRQHPLRSLNTKD